VLLEKMESRRLIELWRYINEYLEKMVYDRAEDSKILVGCIQVYDLQGLSAWHFAKVKMLLERLIQPLMVDTMEYYVGQGYHCFILGAPVVLMPLWQILRLWINKRIESKTTVAHNVPQKFYDMVGRDRVPHFLCSEGTMMGKHAGTTDGCEFSAGKLSKEARSAGFFGVSGRLSALLLMLLFLFLLMLPTAETQTLSIAASTHWKILKLP